MDKKQKFQNDPAKFFLFQDKLLTKEEKEKAVEFSQKVFNSEICSLCQKQYDLGIRAPRIMVHCGHTFCTACLYLYFKDQRIRCPLCQKVIKRLRVVEILPLNHYIHSHLINTLPDSSIDPSNRELKLPQEILVEINQRDDSEFPMCPYHNERYQHFTCISCESLYCRVCLEEKRVDCDHHIVDLYLLKPELVNSILDKILNQYQLITILFFFI